jgi:hypothetical protein
MQDKARVYMEEYKPKIGSDSFPVVAEHRAAFTLKELDQYVFLVENAIRQDLREQIYKLAKTEAYSNKINPVDLSRIYAALDIPRLLDPKMPPNALPELDEIVLAGLHRLHSGKAEKEAERKAREFYEKSDEESLAESARTAKGLGVEQLKEHQIDRAASIKCFKELLIKGDVDLIVAFLENFDREHNHPERTS